MEIGREYVGRLIGAKGKTHVKNFRPQLMVMAGVPHERPHLIKFASMLHKGQGLATFVQVLVDDASCSMRCRL